MDFTASEILLFITAISTLINTAISRWQGKRTKEIDKRTKVIEKHVNGEASAARAEIFNLHNERQQFQKIIAEMKQTAALLSQEHESRNNRRKEDKIDKEEI